MKKSNLSSRLSALRSGKDSPGKKQEISGEQKKKRESGPETGGRETFPGWERTGDFVQRKITIIENINPPVPGEELKSVYETDTEKPLLFFDLETTGLSGGAGNIAFLAGAGRYAGGSFKLTQLFLEDYPGEGEFLDELKKLLSPSDIWVSYNGKSFDVSLLKTRFLMNGEIPVIGENLDLLYPARRLWRTVLADCSLGTIEREVLGISRELDIPGRLIPDIYFRYLKSGNTADMDRVFAHHREDIVTLLVLYNLLGNIFSKPPSAGNPVSNGTGASFDPAGLGFLLLKADRKKGIGVLVEGLGKGNRRCGFILGEFFKREKNWAGAGAIWKKLWDYEKEPAAGTELAKYLEHRRGDFAGALEIVKLLVEQKNLSEKITAGLVHRRERLERKIQLYR